MVVEKKYRLVCIDIDGTLAKDDKSISEFNKKTLKKLSEKGVNVAIASGRTLTSIKSIMEEIGIPLTAICLNGGQVIVNNETIHTNFLNYQQVDCIFKTIAKFNANATFNGVDFSIRNHDISLQWRAQIENGSLKADFIIANDPIEYKQLIYNHVNEIVKVSIMEENKQQFESIKRELQNYNLFSVVKSDTNYIDVTDLNSTKGKALNKLAEYINVAMDDVLSIGDNENDYEMLNNAGVGVAMRNANEKIKNIADFVTLSNNEDGVAYAIHKFLLKD